jgi:hypothetical protein
MAIAEAERATLKIYLGLAGLGALVIAAGGYLHYQDEPSLPPPAPVEKKPEARDLSRSMTETPDGYKAIVTADARRFGVGVTISALADPLPYHLEFEGDHRLVGKDSLQTASLEISARVEKQWSQMGGDQGIGVDQFLLTIKNKTDHHLAYRVQTEVPDARVCRSKGVMPHNAIALKPHEQVTRSECLWARGFFANVRRVEVIELPPFSYYYVSRLHPPHVLYAERTSQGHQTPIGKPCELVPWREIQAGAESGEIKWEDVIDFYARHNCDEYTFARGYKRRQKRDEVLPASAQAAQK